jgi:hypothetical protein
MRKRRKRRPIRWKPVLILLLLANLAVGLMISPITAAHTVRVVGVLQEDQPAVRKILQGIKNKPYFQVNTSSVESQLLGIERIKRADLSRNILGRGVLEVGYREPVASVVEHPTVKLSAEGELYRDARQIVGIPAISLPTHAHEPNLTLGFAVELKALAEISGRTQRLGLGDNLTITVDKGGRLCLNKEGNGQVVLGSSQELDAKFERLKTYLEQNPDGLTHIKELNITAPERPAVIR